MIGLGLSDNCLGYLLAIIVKTQEWITGQDMRTMTALLIKRLSPGSGNDYIMGTA